MAASDYVPNLSKNRLHPKGRPQMGSGRQLLYRLIVKRLIACLTAGLLANGCEQMQPMLAEAGYTHDLGEFEVEQIGFVQEMPGPGDGFDGGGYLKLELASAH